MELINWKKYYESEAFKNQYECPKEQFGAIYHKHETTFRVWAPVAVEVVLHLYKDGIDLPMEADDTNYQQAVTRYGTRIPMSAEKNGIFEVTLQGDLHGVYYTYEVRNRDLGSIDLTTQNQKNAGIINTETIDPYATASGANGYRAMVIDMEKTNPPGWEQDSRFIRSSDSAIIYELHVKDFSHDVHSGIREENRGKYLAFTEKGTTVDCEGKYSTGVDYLKELGITHVHLLPTYDFGSVDELGNSEQFNWGYDPVNYRVPEGSYASDPKHGEVRISEFKQMVKALHDAGIGVVLDMVFNHTFSLDSPLQRCVPYYYYRQREDGSLCNGSGCGNETASERAMYRSYIIDTVLFWANEYHIDGFRFDLMGVHDTETMNELRDALNALPKGKNILLYGEPWSAEPVILSDGLKPANKANIRSLNERIAVFHDGTRDAIKGSVFEAKEGGFVNGGAVPPEEIKHSVLAWCDTQKDDTPKSPKQVISYVSAHDNYSLWDKLVLTMDETEDYVHGTEEILQCNKLIAAMLQMSLGTPFFQAGEEFARTKLGDDNSYVSSPSVNQLDWLRRVEQRELVEYYKGLIRLRKMCSVFTAKETDVVDSFVFDVLENSLVSYQIRKTGCFKWSVLYVVLNAGKTEKTVSLPCGTWQLLVDEKSSTHYNNKEKSITDSVTVTPMSAMILGRIMNVEDGCGKKKEYHKNKGGRAMEFFAKVSEKLTETGKFAVEAVKDTSEVISLKNKISGLKKDNKSIYEEIGRTIVEREAKKEESEFKSLIERIQKNQDEMDRIQQKIDLIKENKK